MQKSFKKTLALILSIVMIIGVLPMGLSFAAETEGDFTYEIADGKAVVIGYNGPAAVVVPETLGGKPVVKIGNDPVRGVPFFHSNGAITSVVLPDTVEEIVPGSFYGCTNLETIDLGGATKIGDTAFVGCSKLTTITMDADVEVIERNAFNTDTIKNVNFEGTIAQWNAILANMATGNTALTNATVVYCYGKNCEHNYEVKSDTATCYDDGIKVLVCIDCGYETEEYSYSEGHHFNFESIEESAYITVPTCTTDGLAKLNCEGCGEEFTVWLPALGHKVAEDGWKILTEATCTTDGSKVGECVVCLKWTSEVIPHFGHNEEVILGQNADCINPGYTESRYCTTCETYTAVAETIPALGHDYYKDENVSSEPTCTVAGLYLKICGRCGDRKYEAVSNLGHDIVNVEAKAPTCEEYGWNAYEYCTRCNYIKDYIELPAKGHTPGAEATCTTAQTCTDCDFVYVEALDHTLVNISGKDATCTVDGYTSAVFCTRCKEVLVDSEPIFSVGHKGVAVEEIPATCEEDGFTSGIKCSVCYEWILAPEVIPATGHNRVVVPKVDPTCTTKGSTAGEKCANCGEIYIATQDIDSLGHNIVDVNAKAATCTETGLTAGKKCNRDGCDFVLVPQEETPMIDHDLDVVPGQAPTCTENGYSDQVYCKVCNTVVAKHEIVDATGHMPGPAATCTAPQICTVCEVVLVAKLPHTAGAAATCTTSQKCVGCDYVFIPALGHDMEYDMTVTNFATCVTDGYEKGHCKRCTFAVDGKTYAKQHNIQNWTITQEAKCGIEGAKVGYCLNCMYNIPDVIPALEHTDVNGDKKCDYCSTSMGGIVIPGFGNKDEDDDGECSCNCHAIGIKGLIFDFILFLQRLFGLNKTCKCGVAHY